MTFIKVSQERFQWVYGIYLLASAVVLGLGHWFTLRSENRSATGETLQKEKEIYRNIGLTVQNDDKAHRQPDFITDTMTPALRVGLFFLTGGILAGLPFLLVQPMEKALLVSLMINLPVLTCCSIAKARYYKVPVGMEIVRTTLLTIIAIGLIYGIVKSLA